jgi:hypothetical protein
MPPRPQPLLDAPIDRWLRAVYQRDMWSYPAHQRTLHQQLVGTRPASRPTIDEWIGDMPIFRLLPSSKEESKIPEEDRLWDSSY